MTDPLFIPSTGQDFVPSTTTPASGPQDARSGSLTDRWPTAGVDPDQVLSAALDRAEELVSEYVSEQLRMSTWENANRIRRALEAQGLPAIDVDLYEPNPRNLIPAAFLSAADDLGLTARQLRGDRLVRRVVLGQVQRLCERLIEHEIDTTPGPESVRFGRVVRFLLARHLRDEEGHDQRRARKQAAAGGDASDPAPYRAPTAPHPNAEGA